MNSKFVYGFLCVILCAIPLGYAIKCYRCLDEVSCRNPSYVECTAAYATETVIFLDFYFQNVTTVASNSFDCMSMNVNYSITSNYHKGCIYSSMSSCEYKMRPNISYPNRMKCYQCNNFNGCNPADRSHASIAILVLPLFFLFRYIMK